MSEATSHAPGIPSWVDLGTPDAQAAVGFYSALFGWEGDTIPDAGGYTIMRLHGKPVVGISPPPPGQPARPPAWMTYVSTADADATTAKVRAAGGAVLFEPMQVMTAGRMAVFMDPAGAAFSVWQPGDHVGAELVNEPGALCWNELQTRDIDGSKTFYRAVFGWGSETHGGPIAYTEWKQDGRSIGGMMSMDVAGVPKEVPPHWLAYLGAADCDAASEKATQLGGRVIVPPMDIQDGLRFSVVADPQGAVFGILRTAG
ncbi:MAG: VOC family protein [Chloroflexi bacterium]|nr:MAG: VOC family protein [Chloroflexota bacterium]